MADWKKIKAEYITGTSSYRQLSDKYGLSFRTLADRAKKDGWVALRAKHRDKIVTKACRYDEKKTVQKLQRLRTSADKLVEVLDQASGAEFFISTQPVVDAAGRPVLDKKGRACQQKVVDAKTFRAMVAATRELTEVVRNLYELPVGGQESGPVRVEFETGMEDYAQ